MMLDKLMIGVREIAESGHARTWVGLNYPTQTQKAMILDKRKALSEADKNFFLRLFSRYDMYNEAQEFRREIDKDNIRSYDRASQFALEKLKLTNIKFNLTNPFLISTLEARSATFPESSKVTFENSIQTIQERFIEQGLAPYDSKFFRDIQRDLGYQHEYEAIRYARSETGHVQSVAQNELYKRNGVEGKEWVTATFGVRDTHKDVYALDTGKKYTGINGLFQVGEWTAQYPLDSSLGPEEFCNCRCDVLPYFFHGVYETPSSIWSGS
jgi:hypothetical protein